MRLGWWDGTVVPDASVTLISRRTGYGIFSASRRAWVAERVDSDGLPQGVLTFPVKAWAQRWLRARGMIHA